MPPPKFARNWLIPLVAGLAAPTLLVGVWGALLEAFWFPGVRYLWDSHQVKTIRRWSFDASWSFDAAVGLLLGVAISLAIVQLLRGEYLRAGIVFLLSFVAASIAPNIFDGDYSLTMFYFTQPLVLFFGLASPTIFFLAARGRSQHHVP